MRKQLLKRNWKKNCNAPGEPQDGSGLPQISRILWQQIKESKYCPVHITLNLKERKYLHVQSKVWMFEWELIGNSIYYLVQSNKNIRIKQNIKKHQSSWLDFCLILCNKSISVSISLDLPLLELLRGLGDMVSPTLF